MAAVIRDVNGIVEPFLKIPDDVNLEIYDQYNLTRADSATNTIYIGYYRGLARYSDRSGFVDGIPGYKKSPRISRAILAHEYGHLLLDANLGAAKEILMEARNNPLINQLTYGDQKLTEAKWAAKKRRDVLWLVRSGYHELFADVVAAVYARDLRIMSDAINFQTGPLSGEHISELLDFERRTSIELSPEEKDDVHTQMNVARRYVGTHYLNRMMKPTLGRARFLKILARAIDDEIVEIANRSDLSMVAEALSPFKIREDNSVLLQLNQRLIQRMNTLAKQI